FLQPGMMTGKDEQELLEELQSNPPHWLMYLHLDRAEFLRVFPQGASLDSRFERLEAWLDRNYQPAGVTVAGYPLWRRVSSDPAEAPVSGSGKSSHRASD